MSSSSEVLVFLPFILIGLIGLAIYFIPMIAALARNHPNKAAIILVNIFLGWSLIGWIVALVWAFTKPNTQAPIIVNAAVPANESFERKLQELSGLRSNGLITEEEFQSKRAQLLEKM